MPQYTVLYDDLQEARWFRNLNRDFLDAREVPITDAQSWPSTRRVLAYDRPDIVLLDGDTPILVIEETVEVPSGHNVGQRLRPDCGSGRGWCSRSLFWSVCRKEAWR